MPTSGSVLYVCSQILVYRGGERRKGVATFASHLRHILRRKMPPRYLEGIFWRCLAVFELSILIGIITLKSALETATRHFSQLLIRVIPKKCRQMSSRYFLIFQMAIKASYGIIFPANLLHLHYDSLSRNNLKI